MQITESHFETAAVLTLQGRLDQTSAKELAERLERLLDQGQAKLVVDLAGVDYLASPGLQVLLKAFWRTNLKEGRLVLCSLSDYAAEVFDLTGLSLVFSIAADRQEALAQIE